MQWTQNSTMLSAKVEFLSIWPTTVKRPGTLFTLVTPFAFCCLFLEVFLSSFAYLPFVHNESELAYFLQLTYFPATSAVQLHWRQRIWFMRSTESLESSCTEDSTFPTLWINASATAKTSERDDKCQFITVVEPSTSRPSRPLLELRFVCTFFPRYQKKKKKRKRKVINIFADSSSSWRRLRPEAEGWKQLYHRLFWWRSCLNWRFPSSFELCSHSGLSNNLFLVRQTQRNWSNLFSFYFPSFRFSFRKQSKQWVCDQYTNWRAVSRRWNCRSWLWLWNGYHSCWWQWSLCCVQCHKTSEKDCCRGKETGNRWSTIYF